MKTRTWYLLIFCRYIEIPSGKSLVWINIESGPRTNSCETPKRTLSQDKVWPLRTTFCLQWVKWFSINLTRLPQILFNLSLYESLLCHTLSKILEMSKETPLISVGGFSSNYFLYYILYLRVLKGKNLLWDNQADKLWKVYFR